MGRKGNAKSNRRHATGCGVLFADQFVATDPKIWEYILKEHRPSKFAVLGSVLLRPEVVLSVSHPSKEQKNLDLRSIT